MVGGDPATNRFLPKNDVKMLLSYLNFSKKYTNEKKFRST